MLYSMKNRNTEIALLVLTVAACAIPFLGQPFHMDDGLYMDIARNVQKNPLFPNDTPYMFQGIYWSDLGSHSHGPFVTYLLAAIQHFFGEGPGTEWIYHLFALMFPILAVLAFYWICMRFVGRPLWPAMMLACSPLFLVTQHTLMTDLPMLAFWLASICFFLWAVDLRRKVLYSLSAMFQVAAVFTSYQSLALLPLLGFYHLKKGRGRTGWIALAIAPVTISAWYLMNCLHYGRPLWGKMLGYMQSRNPVSPEVLGIKLVSILEYQGWLIIFPFFILYLLARGLKWRACMLASLCAVYLAQFSVPQYGWIEKAIFVVGLVSGFFMATEMGKIGWRAFFQGRGAGSEDQVEAQFIALWYLGYFTYCFVFLKEGSARYILPMIPPIILCFFQILEKSEVSEYRLPSRLLNSAMLASGCLVISLIWGLTLSRADEEFAKIYPRVATKFKEIADNLDSYSSGEWGFRYYLGRVGAQPLPADSSLVRGGSFIAVPKLAQPNDIPPDLKSLLIPVQKLTYRPSTPVRVLDWQTPAGFWSSGWGLIPFSFSWRPLEQVEVFQVNFMAERLPWARIRSASGIQPWPGFLAPGGQSSLAILARPGTKLRYGWPVSNPMSLDLQCGLSPDSYQNGSDKTFQFVVSQTAEDGSVLAEQRLLLHPGIRKEDRNWQPVRILLKPDSGGFLDFEYEAGGGGAPGIGAFAQALLRPIN
jgi:4-amino-4-deoxy-L-arabinose transferase-like glycosyltransferase